MGIRRRSFFGVTLALIACSAKMLPAQREARAHVPVALADSALEWTIRLPKPTGCVAAISPASMQRVLVYLQASASEHSDTALMLQADLMAQDVAEDFRKLLGAPEGTVPIADSTFVWYSVPTELVVIVHRNGDVVAHEMGSGGDSAATTFLSRAFVAARARDAAFMVWPDDLTGDSVIVRLSLWPEHAQSPYGEKHTKFAVFSLNEPEQSPVLPLPVQRVPHYPRELEWSRVGGSVLSMFVVDTAGRVEPQTIRDLLPDGKPIPGGDAHAHELFARSVKSWLRDVRFHPARIGTCAVEKRVQLPLKFKAPGRT
jgi:hypothetical protein